MARLVAAGQSIPRPYLARAEIDTGAAPTAIALPVLLMLGLLPIRRDVTITAGGRVDVDIYEITLGLAPVFGLATTFVLANDLEVTALAHPIPDTDLLLGLDSLLNCILTIDGPARTFTLDI